ncbi:MAG: hypothetical protein WC284_12425 [Candidimonas sp.]
MKLSDLMETPIGDITVVPTDDPDESGFDRRDQKATSSEKFHNRYRRAFSKTPYVIDVIFDQRFRGWYGDKPNDNDDVDRIARKVSGIYKKFEEYEAKPGVITLIMVGNLSPLEAKLPLTPWILAHKLGHAIQDVNAMDVRKLPQVNNKIRKITRELSALVRGLSMISDKVFRFKSAKIDGPPNEFELEAELIAEYLIRGEVEYDNDGLQTFKDADQKEIISDFKEINELIKALLDLCVGKILVET